MNWLRFSLKNFEKLWEKEAVKRVEMQILKNGHHYFSSWSNVCLNSKFQAALMFDSWGNCEQTRHFLICVWKKHGKCPKNLNFSEMKSLCNFFCIKNIFNLYGFTQILQLQGTSPLTLLCYIFTSEELDLMPLKGKRRQIYFFEHWQKCFNNAWFIVFRLGKLFKLKLGEWGKILSCWELYTPLYQ